MITPFFWMLSGQFCAWQSQLPLLPFGPGGVHRSAIAVARESIQNNRLNKSIPKTALSSISISLMTLS